MALVKRGEIGGNYLSPWDPKIRKANDGPHHQRPNTDRQQRPGPTPFHAQRLGILSLSRPKLVSPTTSPCEHIEHLPELDVGHPLGA
jgi:hypothetical protein